MTPEERARCLYGDPTCPCQDGLVCHYVDHGESKAMLVRPDYVLNARRAAETEAHNAAVEACAQWARENLQRYTVEIAATMFADKMQIAIRKDPQS